MVVLYCVQLVKVEPTWLSVQVAQKWNLHKVRKPEVKPQPYYLKITWLNAVRDAEEPEDSAWLFSPPALCPTLVVNRRSADLSSLRWTSKAEARASCCLLHQLFHAALLCSQLDIFSWELLLVRLQLGFRRVGLRLFFHRSLQCAAPPFPASLNSCVRS